MGHLVEITDTGIEIEVHVFDHRKDAAAYVLKSRGYTFDRHEPWAFTGGFDFYRGPNQGEHSAVSQRGGKWRAVFWIDGDVKVTPAAMVSNWPAFHGEYRVGGKWKTVCNDGGNAISYASAEAALAGAKLRVQEAKA